MCDGLGRADTGIVAVLRYRIVDASRQEDSDDIVPVCGPLSIGHDGQAIVAAGMIWGIPTGAMAVQRGAVAPVFV